MKAIIAEPEVDLHRLVFADFIEENGQPDRAEFIRLMCERPASKAGVRRARELHRLHGREWFPYLPESSLYAASSGNPCTVIRRGFVDSVQCHMEWWHGRPCGRPTCHGGRVMQNAHSSRRCRFCVRGRGSELVRNHPVAKVQITDVEPAGVADFDGTVHWQWVCNKDQRDPSTLPRFFLPQPIFDKLNAGRLLSTWFMFYNSEDDARSDLSDALIRWAKR